MGLIDAGAAAKLDRYIGYYEPYYNSHDALDKDKAVQEEVTQRRPRGGPGRQGTARRAAEPARQAGQVAAHEMSRHPRHRKESP